MKTILIEIFYLCIIYYTIYYNLTFIKFTKFNNITKKIKTINFMSYNDFINIDFSF